MTITGKEIHAAWMAATPEFTRVPWEELDEYSRGRYERMAAYLSARYVGSVAVAAYAAYAFDSDRMTVYYHPGCLSQYGTLMPLTLSEVPPGAVCGVPWCQKPISEAPRASER